MNDSLLKIIDRSISGIIWVTRDIPSHKDDYFNTIDYLLNGLVRKSSLLDTEKANVFFTKSFGETFFVIHMIESEDIYEKLNDVFQGLKKQIHRESKILYISEDNSHSEKILSILSSIADVKGIIFNQTHF